MPKKSSKIAKVPQGAKKSSKAAPRQKHKSPEWLDAVRDPNNHSPVGVPDQDCEPSVKYCSKLVTNLVPSLTGGGTVHGLLAAVSPYLVNRGSTGTGVSVVTTLGWGSVNTFGGAVGCYNDAVTAWPAAAQMMPAVDVCSTSTGDVGIYQHRLTAMEAKLTYKGSELNRAGSITMALADPDYTSNSNVLMGNNRLNAISGIFNLDSANMVAGTGTITTTQARNKMKRISVERNLDGAHILRWIPGGAPQYMATPLGSQADYSFLQKLGPFLLILIEGDVTTASAVQGNDYLLEITAHWEFKVASKLSLVVPVTPSPYDPVALAVCLNSFQAMSCSLLQSDGIISTRDDGHVQGTSSAWETASTTARTVADYAGQAYDYASSNQGRQVLGAAARYAAGYSRVSRGAPRLQY